MIDDAAEGWALGAAHRHALLCQPGHGGGRTHTRPACPTTDLGILVGAANKALVTDGWVRCA
jgi:hypothetical protein